MILLHTCDLARNEPVGTNGRRAFTTIQTSIGCTFIPMGAKAAIANKYSVGNAWDFYFADGTDVRPGDRLTRSGVSYIVGGVEPFSGFPGVSHVHATGETEHANGQ